MSELIVPSLDEEPWPSLGADVVDWMEANLAFGPGDLLGRPYECDPEDRALIERMYQVYPHGHAKAGKRRFDTVCVMTRKGTKKSERLAALAAVELAEDGPVRCDGFRRQGRVWVPVGRPVTSAAVWILAFAKEQAEDTSFGAMREMVSRGAGHDKFQVWEERIQTRDGSSEAQALATAPDSRDGGRTTFQGKEEPLALDTPVPTPDGWTTMGDVRPGATVYGLDGSLVNVTDVGPVHEGRTCYRVNLGDGTSIVADALHPWTVFDRSPSYRSIRDVTTEEMARKHWANVARFSLPASAPLDGPDVDLAVDPYVLGLWLGDGDRTNATITSGNHDVDTVEALIAERGYATTRCAVPDGKAQVLYITRPGDKRGATVKADLKHLGVLGRKHIPPRYLRASYEQRLALLQGLMDSDGHISTPQGQVTFDNSDPVLFADTVELLRTLGYHPTTDSRVDMRWSTPRPIQRLRFHGRRQVNPFRLPRKAERVRDGHDRRFRQDLAVVSVEPVESVPVRCITVDSADHLFLAGPGMHPTHNSHRWTLPRHKEAHGTTRGNLSKRPIAEPWEMHATTAYAPGEGSVAEDLHDAARSLTGDAAKGSRMFFFYRWANLSIKIRDDSGAIIPKALREAIIDASGPTVAAWSDIEGIASLQFEGPGADPGYGERVWLNRTVRRIVQAFDVEAWKRCVRPGYRIPKGALCVAGFDGSRGSNTPGWSPDHTGLLIMELATGHVESVGHWDPLTFPGGMIDRQTVDVAVDAMFTDYEIWRLYADPYDWDSEINGWIAKYGDDHVVPWATWRDRPMAAAIANLETAIVAGQLTHDPEHPLDSVLTNHIGNAHRRDVTATDSNGKRLHSIQKERPGSILKIDLAMSLALALEAYNDAIAAGAGSSAVRNVTGADMDDYYG